MHTHFIGRLAPSPTGAQHVGNARTYLFAWLLLRQSVNGQLILRIEDLETPRVKPWAVEQIYDDLEWLGLDWDASPRSPLLAGSELIQSLRTARYRMVLEELIARRSVYPCTCSRSDIATASAPHESHLDGLVYPGTCRHRDPQSADELQASNTPFCWRYRWDASHASFADSFLGLQEINPARELGDFVVWRVDDQAAYQLAVVVDDHDAGVNQVVRGADLVFSTFRQNAIYNDLTWEKPIYFHAPLVVGTDGRRLAKRHGDTRLSSLRELGIAPEQLIGYLAWHSGLVSRLMKRSCRDLLDCDLSHTLYKSPLVFDAQKAIDEMRNIDA